MATRRPAPKRKTRNPSSACLPTRRASSKSRGFNVYEGQSITYKGTRYKVIGCGIGATATRSIGVQAEGTYALLNERTNKVRYVAKRVVRDIAYHRGLAGRPAAKGRLTAKRRKGARKTAAKMSAAKKADFIKRMAAARARKAR